MKKLKLIYNPNSGDRSFRDKLDDCVKALQEGGFDVHIFRSRVKGDIERHIWGLGPTEYHTILSCGGDGTANMVINAMMARGITAKLGIIPAGTANDFAAFLNMPKDPGEACKVIAKGDTMPCDLGLADGKFFLNVFGAGFLTSVSQSVNENFKNALGKLAYYLKGIEQAQNYSSVPVRITYSGGIIEQSACMLLVLNGAGAGGFENLAPLAKADDGLLDFIAFTASNLAEIAVLYLKVLRGDYLGDSNIIFFQDSHIKIEPLAQDPEFTRTDVDGEPGPELPVEIYAVPSALTIYHNRTKGETDGF